MKKEVINYFNNLSGRVVDDNDILSNETGVEKISENLLKAIKDNQFSNSGSFKTCVFFGDDKKPIFACLKSKKPYSQPQMAFIKNRDYQIKRLNDKLISEGALITPIYARIVYRQNNKGVEISKRISGDVLSVNNLSNFSKKVLGRALETDQLFSEKTPAKVKEKLGNALFEYNYNQQKVMVNLPQENYDKLFKTFLIFNNHGLRFTDCHSENVMVGENGFRVIDVDYDKLILSKTRGTHYETNKIIFDYLNPFSYSNLFHTLFTVEQQQKLYNNNIEILKKLVDGVTNNNSIINLSADHINELMMGMVGVGNFLDKHNYILESQINLRKEQGLNPDTFTSNIKVTRKK